MVFADRAEVTRTTKVSCKAGTGQAVFSMLPMSLDERTLRAEASGKSKAIGLTSRVEPLEEDLDQRVAKVRKELVALNDKIRVVHEEKAGLSERTGVLASYGAHFQTLLYEQVRNPRPDPRRWSEVLEAMRAERLRTAGLEGKIAIKMRDLRRQKERLERRLQALQPRRVAEARVVTVAVDCRGAKSSRVSLSYVVPGATWHPEYDLRFVTANQTKVGRGRAELTVAAVVQQATGEDWTNAKLILSTSRPKLGSEAPVPAPLYVNGRKVGEVKTLVATRERREKLAGAEAAAAPPPAGVALEDKGQSFALSLPRRVNVMADGRPYWMPVDVTTAKAQAKLVTIPKLKPYVYQVVQFKNPAAYPLLRGRIHVYRGGSYVGDTDTEYRAPGEAMEISLGLDEEFKVERKDLKATDRSAGFLSSTKHLERAYRIQITNRARKRQAVEVRENIPVSKTEQVEVELKKDETTPHFQFDRHRGFITWTVRLSPAQKKSIDLAYTIHLPEDWKVQVR
jgi:uncharacterized protein (TIGR02231 family)